MAADLGASVLARLKRKAADSGGSYQLCLQLFCQEELLRRLEKSRYVDNFILKGGLFLYTLTNFDSRVTIDVDFLLRNTPNTPERIENVLKEIISTKTDSFFVSFEIIKVEPISIAKKYSGISATLMARIKNTRTPICVDFGFGDVVVPHEEKRSIPTQLPDFYAPTVNTYSLESFIAEKLDAILNLMDFSSRMKDYYDLWYLATHFAFDKAVLSKALRQTFAVRQHSFSLNQFKQVVSFGSDENMKRKWGAFTKKIDATDVDFNTVLKAINSFLFDAFANSIADV